MKTMTAREAKTHFGELLDAMQREPVLVTKNNRPVGIMISIQDAADTLIPEMFMEKEEGYDDWFQAKVSRSFDAINNGQTNTSSHEDTTERVWQKLRAKTRPATE